LTAHDLVATSLQGPSSFASQMLNQLLALLFGPVMLTVTVEPVVGGNVASQ
jgi:hypothetical protein